MILSWIKNNIDMRWLLVILLAISFLVGIKELKIFVDSFKNLEKNNAILKSNNSKLANTVDDINTSFNQSLKDNKIQRKALVNYYKNRELKLKNNYKVKEAINNVKDGNNSECINKYSDLIRVL